jgi:hypothetical protein
MRAWFLFAILAFLVFGVPLMDELYRFRVRRETNRLATAADAVILVPEMLVPEMNEHAPTSSCASTPVVRTPETV